MFFSLLAAGCDVPQTDVKSVIIEPKQEIAYQELPIATPTPEIVETPQPAPVSLPKIVNPLPQPEEPKNVPVIKPELPKPQEPIIQPVQPVTPTVYPLRSIHNVKVEIKRGRYERDPETAKWNDPSPLEATLSWSTNASSTSNVWINNLCLVDYKNRPINPCEWKRVDKIFHSNGVQHSVFFPYMETGITYNFQISATDIDEKSLSCNGSFTTSASIGDYQNGKIEKLTCEYVY